MSKSASKEILRFVAALGQPALSSRVREIRASDGTTTTDSSAASADAVLSKSFCVLDRDEQRALLGDRTEITAIIETSRGTMELVLFAREAPATVAHFLKLAKDGFFNGILTHRVVPLFVAQFGCPRGDGYGGPGFVLPCELNARTYTRGSLGMALAGQDTGGSQWFLCHEAQPHLDLRYTIFGHLRSGYEVLDALRPGDSILKVIVP
jgi:peptidyl-prolyl cis-trans isomerase B (cyclophilin B)